MIIESGYLFPLSRTMNEDEYIRLQNTIINKAMLFLMGCLSFVLIDFKSICGKS